MKVIIRNFSLKNGGVLLEELVAFCNGRSNPIRHFSEKELLMATNYNDGHQMFFEVSGYKLYEGSLKDLPIIMKKYKYLHPGFSPYKDIAIGSQMSAHKNVLKVLGCCLETKDPTVIYEFVGTKSLSTCICGTNVQPLPWKSRLEIAVDLANAITYLHTAFSRPVIHWGIIYSNILLDENNVPKLTDFGLCISIPEGQSQVEDAARVRPGSAAPEYWATGYITEKADVYLFGMLLLELLIGEKPTYAIQEHNLQDPNMKPRVKNAINAVDQRITHERIEEKQLLDFTTLLLRCMSFDEERRTIIKVAKELRRIHQSFTSPC